MHKEDKKSLGIISAIIGAVLLGLGGTYGVYELTKDSTPKPKPIVKIGAKSDGKAAAAVFRTRFKDLEEYSRFVLDDKGSKVYEEELFDSFDIKTKKEKNLFYKEWFKTGGKRYKQICYDLNSANGEWGAGICYLEPAPVKGLEA